MKVEFIQKTFFVLVMLLIVLIFSNAFFGTIAKVLISHEISINSSLGGIALLILSVITTLACCGLFQAIKEIKA